MDKRMRESLGWPESNQEIEDDEYCDEDCSKCKIKLNYTMFDQEDDGDID